MNGKKIRKAVAATALAAAGILLLFFAVSRIAEFRPAAVETTVFDTAAPDPLPDTITLLSWNIGYAGLGDDMDFFYDGGRKVRGERRRTEKNLMEIIAALQSAGADIILLQEVDRGSRRSYGLDEAACIEAGLPGYTASFAANFKTWWVPIPLRSPMGRVHSGLLTLSRRSPLQSSRISYPSAFPFPQRMFDLKRCLLASQFPTLSGDTLLVVNTHNTAYDTGGMRTEETRFLSAYLEERLREGIASVTGGDWNQYPPDYRPSTPELSNPNFVPEPVDSTLFGDGFRFVWDPSEPTLRYLDAPFDVGKVIGPKARAKGLGYSALPEWKKAQLPRTTLTDFFVVSDGVEVLSVETLPLDFRLSDHNPVRLKIALHGLRGRAETQAADSL